MQYKAKQLLKQLNKQDITKYEATDKALELMKEYDIETGEINMVDDEDINNIIKNDINNYEYDWQRVACFLGGVDSLNPPYGFMLNGYGNLKEITFNDIVMWVETIAQYDGE